MKLNYLKVLVSVAAAVLITSGSVHASETDARIESSAKQSYVFRTFLKNDAVKVQSKDGAVKLTGTVAESHNKALAQETLTGMPGVKSVDNQVKVKSKHPIENSDAWIGLQIKYSLLYNRNVSGLNTHISVSKGIVTLKGEAESQAQKDLTNEYAKDVKGVKDIVNEMTIAKNPIVKRETVGEMIDDASITAQVKMALFSHYSTSAFKTGVTTSNGVVTLSGKATSGAAKDMATKVTADVSGVNSVVNDMIIVVSVSKK